MHAPPTQQLPPLDRRAEGPVTVYLNPLYPGEVDCAEILRLPSILEGLKGRSSRQPGRISSWDWTPDWHDGPGLVVRQYLHGGSLGRIAGSLFLGTGRMRRELAVSAYAHGHQVPTSAPVAVRTEKVCGPLVTAYFISQRIPRAQDLLAFLTERGAEQALCVDRNRRLAAAIAAAVAAMHDAGIVHADLNLKNLLVRDAFDEPQVFIIDFDQAALTGRLSLDQRMANLVRLDRSVMKWEASRRAVSLKDRLRVARCYLRSYHGWRAQWGQIVRDYGSRHLRHFLSRERSESKD